MLEQLKLFFENKNNFNVEEVRKISDVYKNGFSKKQNKYKNQLCKEIIDSARSGARSIYTDETGWEDWFTEEFLFSLMDYFTERGFEVSKTYNSGSWYLKISW